MNALKHPAVLVALAFIAGVYLAPKVVSITGGKMPQIAA